ncbi:MAG: exosortase/archaeosortase family protein [Opitutia bacterium]
MASADEAAGADRQTLAFGGILAAMMAFAAWDQWAIWSTKDDYTFGYLVPFLAAYVLWDRWEPLQDALKGGTGAPAPGWTVMAAYVLAFASLATFALGAAGRAVFGTGPVPTLAIAFGVAGAGLAFAFLAPRGTLGAEPSAAARLNSASLMTFPSCVWVVSGPFLYLVDNRVKGELLTLVTEVVSGILRASGHVIRTSGNTIVFANNDAVGVADACSGIRSLSACVFAAAFLGAVFIEGGRWGSFIRKSVLILAGGGVAILLNLGRNVYLAGHALDHGSKSLDLDLWGVPHGAPGFSFLGTVHDLAGNVAMVLALVLLVALVPLLNRLGRTTPER